MPAKNETIQKLHELQQQLEQKESRDLPVYDARDQAMAEKRIAFQTKFREFMRESPIYKDLLQLIESDLLVAELTGIWELVRRRIIEEHDNQNRILRRLPMRSPLLTKDPNDYIKVESFLPNLEEYIEEQTVGLMVDEDLDKRVAQRSSWYWMKYNNPVNEGRYYFRKDVAAITVDIPHKNHGRSSFIKISCVADFSSLSLDNVHYTITSAGLDLDDKINFTFDDVITYLADFLRKNDILFTPGGRKQRE